MVAWSMTLRDPFWQRRHLRRGQGSNCLRPKVQAKNNMHCKTTHTRRHFTARRRGVVTALKPVRAEQVRRPEPPVALGARGYYPLPAKFLKSLDILNAISCDLVHLMLQVPI